MQKDKSIFGGLDFLQDIIEVGLAKIFNKTFLQFVPCKCLLLFFRSDLRASWYVDRLFVGKRRFFLFLLDDTWSGVGWLNFRRGSEISERVPAVGVDKDWVDLGFGLEKLLSTTLLVVESSNYLLPQHCVAWLQRL